MRRLATPALFAALTALAGVVPLPVAAIEEIVVEEQVSDLLLHAKPKDGTEELGKRQWALLPQLGYGPDTGPVIGVKFTHRNFRRSGMTFDVDATYAALNQRQSIALSLGNPHLGNDRFLVNARVKWRFDPQREFFALGNNDIGPDPASTHELHDLNGTLIAGWRLAPRLALNGGIRVRWVQLRHGDGKGGCGGVRPCPFTQGAFPDLTGVNGGEVTPIFISLVYNDRDDLVRPTRGWRAIAKAEYAPRAPLADFKYARFFGDVGYLFPLFTERFVLGVRADGAWVEAHDEGTTPFWELVELGGEDTLRGYFPHRFFGRGRVLLNAELRALLFEFDFFRLWHVKIDGVLEGEGGRVFLEQSEARNDFGLPAATADRIESDLRYSYGGGLRIGLSDALVARLDAAFSEEETGLFYLTFGHTF